MCDCDPKNKDCFTWVSWEELESDYKLPWTRQHVLERMVPEGQFPVFQRLGKGPKSRIALLLCKYKTWVLSRPDVEYVPSPDDFDDAAP